MRILYTDTDISRKQHVQGVLESAGHQITLANHVSQAVLFLNNQRFDHVICYLELSQCEMVLELLYLRNQAGDPRMRALPITICGPLQSPSYELRLQAMGADRQMDVFSTTYSLSSIANGGGVVGH